MRIAIISDIHGNLVALEIALADIDRENPDRIVCLGDIAALGPQPRETVERLRTLNCPVVMGNTDAWLLNPRASKQVDENARRIEEVELWCAKQLSSVDLDYLRAFKPTIEVPLDGGATLLCFHGSPKSNMDVILSKTSEEDLDRMLSGFHASIMAGGHTHVQMLRRYRDAIIINPGSVGLPHERAWQTDQVRNPPWAEYALVSQKSGDLGIEFRRVPLDVKAVIQAALDSSMPHVDWWTADWR